MKIGLWNRLHIEIQWFQLLDESFSFFFFFEKIAYNVCFLKLTNKDIDFEKKIRPCCIDNKKRNQAKINIIQGYTFCEGDRH